MTMPRRDFVTALGGIAAIAALRPSTSAALPPQGPVAFPRKDDFSIEEGYDYGPPSAASMFEMGTLVGSTEVNLALLASSLAYVKSLGPANIQAHRLPLTRRLQQEVPRLGFTAVTPPDSKAGNVTFTRRGLAESDLPRRLAAAKVNVRLGLDWMRLSPSVYNDLTDVERFLNALA